MADKTIKRYRCKNAGIKDYALIEHFLQKSELPVEGVKEHIDFFLLIYEDDRLIGTAGLEVYGKQALLRSVAVDKSVQGKGWGHIITHKMIAKAKTLNITDLYLLTETAADFFRNFGFELVDRSTVGNDLQTSVEFKFVCPESAFCMIRRL